MMGMWTSPRRTGLLLAAAVIALSACATKGDVRNLQMDMLRMQHHQDSVLAEIQLQNRLLLDSIRQTMALTVDARGTTANQLRQFDQSLNRFGELVGQIMGSLGRIEQRLTTLEQRPAVAGPPGGGAPAGAPGGATRGGGTAAEYYDTGVQMMAAGSYATARMAFEQLLAEFPDHERAPDAQFQLGETFYRQEQWDEAYAALEQVAERWPDAPRAAGALFRAGAIAEERRDVPRARRYYTQVREGYPGSDEARQAQQRLRSLPSS
ncbi:MAG TPA: tol-pal system protein YbgF [Longimicrobiales bacterium]|nr:tol-pal system protein YbgF [Longimicrobiales bacterium]